MNTTLYYKTKKLLERDFDELTPARLGEKYIQVLCNYTNSILNGETVNVKSGHMISIHISQGEYLMFTSHKSGIYFIYGININSKVHELNISVDQEYIGSETEMLIDESKKFIRSIEFELIPEFIKSLYTRSV